MREEFPSTVDFRILGACDLDCPFCFGPRHELRAMPTAGVLQILDRLAQGGVENVVFTGGEPCLIADLPQILAHAKSRGLRTVLSTNGVIFRRRMDQIAPLLDWVGLPLDAATPDLNRRMRPGRVDQFSAVVAVLQQLRSDYPAVGVKLGTVVCALNRHEVSLIPSVLGASKPDVWKLYQVVYSSYGHDNRALLELDDAAYAETVDASRAAAASWQVRLVPYRRNDRPGKYLFIEPNGDVQVATGESESRVGNLHTDSVDARIQWHKLVDVTRLDDNFEATYAASAGTGGRESS